jgi:hypothetical protein
LANGAGPDLCVVEFVFRVIHEPIGVGDDRGRRLKDRFVKANGPFKNIWHDMAKNPHRAT